MASTNNTDRLKNRHSAELREKALALLFVKPLADVAKELGIPKGTLSGWKKSAGLPCVAKQKAPGRQPSGTPNAKPKTERSSKRSSKPERATEQKLAFYPTGPELKETAESERAIQLREFIRSAWSVTIASVNELNDRIVDMRRKLGEIEQLKAYILTHQKQLLDGTAEDPAAVTVLLDKLRSLSVIKTSELATIMGITYDKYQLASGGVTERVGVSFEDMPE